MANLPYTTRPLVWIGDSLGQLSSFPVDTKRLLGFSLRQVQNGETPSNAKPLSGQGAGLYELKADDRYNTYRVVYFVRLKRAIYVLDAFVKKSKRGSKVPQEIRRRIGERLKHARKLDGEQEG
jgi:phage-related protein